MKIKLRLFVMALNLLLFFPMIKKADGEEGGITFTDQDGVLHENVDSNDPDLIAHRQLMQERREQEQERREQEADDGSNPIIDTRHSQTWTDGAENSGNYTDGTYHLSQEYLNNNNGEAIGQVTAAAGSITSQASSVTQDPKTAGIVAAAGSGIGAAGAMVGAVHYGNRAAEYWDAYAQNSATAATNETSLGQIEAQIAALEVSDDSQKAAKIEQLQAQQGMIQDAMQSQEGLADNYFGGFVSNSLFSVLNVGTAGSLGYMGYMQYEQSRKLDSEYERCATDPTLPGCPGHIPPTTNAPPTSAPPERSDVASQPYQDNPEFGRNFSENPNIANGGLLNPPVSGGSGDSPLSFLAGGDSGGGLHSQERRPEEDAASRGLSSDQAYESGGSGGLGLLGGSSFTSPPAPSFDGLDISKFLPAHLKNQDQDPLGLKTVNEADKKKGIVLGKDSPSLFTRITKAHQKKAPEMNQEIL